MPPVSSGRRSRHHRRTTSRNSRWSQKAPTSTRSGRSKLSDAAAIPADGHAHGHHPDLQHHFDTLEQQHEAATLGMWLFLVTEVLFFGGLFMAYLLYRVWYPEAWAEGSRELSIPLGGFNTVVLIGSSLTMAMEIGRASCRERV